MEQTNCLNCGYVLTSGQKFCNNCGQKTATKRITARQMLDDFLYAFAHTDRGLFNLLKGLAIQPGKTLVEYIEGRRKKYFNPFTFLALCIAFMAFMNNWIQPYVPPKPDLNILARIPDENLKKQYLLTVDRMAKAQNFFNKNLNIISVIVAPYFGFFLWLFFRKRKRNMAEITVAYILFTGFSNVLTTILISPWLAFYRDTPAYYPILYGSIILQPLYYAWGLKTFFQYRSAGGYLKILGVLWLSGFIGLVLFLACFFFYLYHGVEFRLWQYMN